MAFVHMGKVATDSDDGSRTETASKDSTTDTASNNCH